MKNPSKELWPMLVWSGWQYVRLVDSNMEEEDPKTRPDVSSYCTKTRRYQKMYQEEAIAPKPGDIKSTTLIWDQLPDIIKRVYYYTAQHQSTGPSEHEVESFLCLNGSTEFFFWQNSQCYRAE